MTFGSLFSGIGGIDLGLDRAGLECRWQVEIDPFCRKVLAKHWPDVPKHDDVRTFPPTEGDWSVDLIAGGFPCQDISSAGKRVGIGGERSGLWTEFARIVREIRPSFVLVENVSALLVRGIDVVLRSLAESGFDAEWFCLPAASLGAPQLRERLFIIAHANGIRLEAIPAQSELRTQADPHSWIDGHAQSGISEELLSLTPKGRAMESGDCGLGVRDGVPNRVQRLRGLGNAVVPQVAEWLGRRILQSAGEAVA